MNPQILLSPHNLFMSRLLLSLLGAYIAHTYRHASHDYWLLMMFLFCIIGVAPSYYQFRRKGADFKDFVRSLLHWSGGLCAVLVVYAYHGSGRIFHEEAGLIVLLILALTTYLDGMQTGWRCMFSGLFLGLIAVCAAYFDSYIWQLAVLAVTVIAVSYQSKGSML